MIRVSTALTKDIGKVTLMELKTQEYPMLVDAVRPYFTDDMKQVYLATIHTCVVGYLLANFLRTKAVVTFDSVGVMPLFRRQGVGRALIDYAVKKSTNNDVKDIQMCIPSYLCDDMNDPWNIDHWLWKMQFKAVGVEHAKCFRYGYHYDYYIFERMQP